MAKRKIFPGKSQIRIIWTCPVDALATLGALGDWEWPGMGNFTLCRLMGLAVLVCAALLPRARPSEQHDRCAQ